MSWFHKGFFWGAPSHKSIAWTGAVSGLLVVALAIFLLALGHGAPLFLLALLFVGLANLGWAIELLPRRLPTLAGWARVGRWGCTLAGWARVGRWGCALAGSALAILSLLWGLTFGLFFGLVIAVGALLQVLEFAPYGPANRPVSSNS
jgi:hypothetical protein